MPLDRMELLQWIARTRPVTDPREITRQAAQDCSRLRAARFVWKLSKGLRLDSAMCFMRGEPEPRWECAVCSTALCKKCMQEGFDCKWLGCGGCESSSPAVAAEAGPRFSK